MADFEGEEALSEEELAQINAHAHFGSSHVTQHLSSMASLYHSHLPRCKSHQCSKCFQVLCICILSDVFSCFFHSSFLFQIFKDFIDETVKINLLYILFIFVLIIDSIVILEVLSSVQVSEVFY